MPRAAAVGATLGLGALAFVIGTRRRCRAAQRLLVLRAAVPARARPARGEDVPVLAAGVVVGVVGVERVHAAVVVLAFGGLPDEGGG